MAILTGIEIVKEIKNGHIRIGNFDPKRVQPNAYDVTLGDKISFYSLTDNPIKIGQIDKETVFETYGMLSLEDPSDETKCGFIRGIPCLDTKKPNTMLTQSIPEDGYVLLPRILYLVESVESVWSDKYVTELSGVSSLARLGITVHKTAGYANLHHEFRWIMEVEVTHPIKIYPGMKFATMIFHTTCGDTSFEYNGKYKNEQIGDSLCGSLSYIDAELEEMEKNAVANTETEVVEAEAVEKTEDEEIYDPIESAEVFTEEDMEDIR